MKFQARKFTCGPAAIANALEVYGVYKTEEELEKLCKTTTEGTGAKGIVKGILGSGFWPQPIKFRDSLKAVGHLDGLVNTGTPAILCVDMWSHWIALVGRMNGKFIIADSASPHLIQFLTSDETADRWRYLGSRFEGFSIERKNDIVGDQTTITG